MTGRLQRLNDYLKGDDLVSRKVLPLQCCDIMRKKRTISMAIQFYPENLRGLVNSSLSLDNLFATQNIKLKKS